MGLIWYICRFTLQWDVLASFCASVLCRSCRIRHHFGKTMQQILRIVVFDFRGCVGAKPLASIFSIWRPEAFVFVVVLFVDRFRLNTH